MSDFPISCHACRRRKIKCNRTQPCDQCLRRGIRCDFPDKFRNVQYEPKEFGESSQPPSEVELLRKEKLAALHENFELSQTNQELRHKLQMANKQSNFNGDENLLDSSFAVTGETTETGLKYYGPQSLNFMIEALKNNRPENGNVARENPTPGPRGQRASIPGDDGAKSRRETIPTPETKKQLPWIVGPDIYSVENITVLKNLVKKFFTQKRYHMFISIDLVMLFIDEHPYIEKDNWEHDDDLLLLLIVLVMAIFRLTPLEFDALRIRPQVLENCKDANDAITNLTDALFVDYNKLRHNIMVESIVTVKAYILCSEWHYVQQKFEESWSMFFHTCAIAYAIGLHVMSKMRTTNDGIEKATFKLAEMTRSEDVANGNGVKVNENDSSNEDDSEYDIARFKTWFALRSFGSQLCSVLGRPNPISLHVNNSVLFTSSQTTIADLELDSRLMQVQLKMGLGETLGLANMMLIESFMVNFTMADVIRLDSRFEQEASSILWYLYNDQAYTVSDLTLNPQTKLPTTLDRMDILHDLIVLHINKSKLVEPFLNHFHNPEDDKYLFDSIRKSIDSFLFYTVDFVNGFFQQELGNYVKTSGEVYQKIRLGSMFRRKYPLLNSFLYQLMVVIFTLLNYKIKDFIQEDWTGFLEMVLDRLNGLLQLDNQTSNRLLQSVHMWSSNILFLFNKNIQYLKMILEKRSEWRSSSNNTNDLKLFLDLINNSVETDSLNFNVKDPFSYTNPDNAPIYFSSPSDDDIIPGAGQSSGEPIVLGQNLLLKTNEQSQAGPNNFSGSQVTGTQNPTWGNGPATIPQILNHFSHLEVPRQQPLPLDSQKDPLAYTSPGLRGSGASNSHIQYAPPNTYTSRASGYNGAVLK